MKSNLVSASVLSADFSCLKEELDKVSNADLIHLDVMDGHFVPNITIGPCVIKDIKKITSCPLDVHLMIANPENMIKDFTKAGSDMITIHYEATKNPLDTIKQIKLHGIKAGLAISPHTSVKVLDDFIEYLDLALIMTVNPGFGGQKFLENQLEKIKYLSNKNIMISVDGGINEFNAKKVKDAGANILVSGSFIFNGNYKKNIELLKNI